MASSYADLLVIPCGKFEIFTAILQVIMKAGRCLLYMRLPAFLLYGDAA
jgi:hypothetical protein